METPKATMEERFAKQRREYTLEITTAVPLLKKMETLVEAKVTFLSLRQRILEDNHLVIENFNKLSRSYREKKSIELVNASQNLQIRFNEREKEKFLDGLPEISKIKTALEILDSQSSFLKESMKTVDQVLFGLKVRVDTEKILLGI